MGNSQSRQTHRLSQRITTKLHGKGKEGDRRSTVGSGRTSPHAKSTTETASTVVAAGGAESAKVDTVKQTVAAPATERREAANEGPAPVSKVGAPRN